MGLTVVLASAPVPDRRLRHLARRSTARETPPLEVESGELDLCVVIVNWNQSPLTIRCVQTLVEDGIQPGRIVVVDNGSTGADARALTDQLPGCTHVRLPANVGYARAANRGATAVTAATYLFVNNDAFVHEPGSVARLVAALSHEGVGIAAPLLRNPDLTLQPSVTPITSLANALVRASGLSHLVPNRWQPRWGTHWDHSESRSVVAVAGTVLAVRGVLWRELGGFTERDAMFTEDLDICWRAGKRGCSVWFEHGAEFVHLGNASGYDSARRAELIGQAEAAMILTELGWFEGPTAIAVLAIGSAARAVLFHASGRHSKGRAAAAYARGYFRWKRAKE